MIDRLLLCMANQIPQCQIERRKGVEMKGVGIAAGKEEFPQLFNCHRIGTDQPLAQRLHFTRAAQCQPADAFISFDLSEETAVVAYLTRSQAIAGDFIESLTATGSAS